jgi:hypothetical protein
MLTVFALLSKRSTEESRLTTTCLVGMIIGNRACLQKMMVFEAESEIFPRNVS